MTDDRIWFVADGHTRRGPMSLESLRGELARPSEGRTRFAWREGMKEWTPPDLVPELIESPTPPPPPPRPEPREPMFLLGTKDPQWFLVGEGKLVVMMLVTLGVYQLYWFYKQWDRVRDAGENLAPAPRALFAIVFCYPLFRRIVESGHAVGVKTGAPAWLLTIGFIAPSLTTRMPEPAFLLGLLAVVPLVAAQRIATAVALAQGSTEDRNTRLTPANWAAIGAAFFIFELFLLALALERFIPLPPA
jgi:hypothetical protein